MINHNGTYRGNRPSMGAERPRYVGPRDEISSASDEMLAHGACNMARLLARYLMSHTPFLSVKQPEARRDDAVHSDSIERVMTRTLVHLIADQDAAILGSYPTMEQRESLLDYMANKRPQLRRIMADASKRLHAAQDLKLYFRESRVSYAGVFMSVFPGIEKDARFQAYVQCHGGSDLKRSEKKFQGHGRKKKSA